MGNDQNLTTEGQSKNKATAVVVIHGLGAHWLLMLPLVWRIRRAGFATVNFGYRSYFKSIQLHSEALAVRLRQLEADPNINQIHLVGHSLGAILTRHLLTQETFSKLNRVVMLTPPNQGSKAAARLRFLLPFSTTVKQLSHHQDSFVNQLGSPEGLELGVLAASYDFVIPRPTSHLPTESDHITVFSGHNGVLVRPAAARQTISFLQHGHFQHAS